MRSSNFKILAATVVLLIASRAQAQNSEPPPYLNPALPAEQRAADLVHRMTVEEKVTQLANQSRAIESLPQKKARRTNQIAFLGLPWAQEVPSSNLGAPTTNS
jgi:hypothetical protein